MDDRGALDADAPLPAHSHSHSHSPPAIRPGAPRALWTTVAVFAAVTLVAALVLWPRGGDGGSDPLLLDTDTIGATVTSVVARPCSYDAGATCRLVTFDQHDGPFVGLPGTIEEATADGALAVGDDILVTWFPTDGGVTYSFYDFEREGSMLWLLALFVAAVVALGRWRGVGAIAGLAFSLVVIVTFTLPAVLDGANAVAVALVTASLIAFAALFLAHGFGLATAVALVSTFASLAVTALLAWFFVGATQLTGLADETSLMLGGLADGVDARGILLAGVVIGALGVLDDVIVTQVAAVWELRGARPDLTLAELVRPALRIGRDHISSTVNTLFLAYAGAALPLLLFFTEAGQGVRNVATRELVATEIVRALVGSIGLVASVPIATWLAAFVVTDDRGGAVGPTSADVAS